MSLQQLKASMTAFATTALFRVASALERPLRLLAVNLWVTLDEDQEEPHGFSAFGISREGRETVFRALGIVAMAWPNTRFGDGTWGQRVLRTWLAMVTRWDLHVERDDPRCDLLDFSMTRHSDSQFEFFGLGLHVLGTPLRLQRR